MQSYRSKHPFLPYALQEIDEEDRQEVKEALKSDVITRGEKVQAFEEAFKNAVDAPFAVAFSSGSTALWAAALSLSLTREDRLFTTPNTFISTAGSFTREGAGMTLVDIAASTANVDHDLLLLEALSWKRTRGRAIYLPIHFAGIPFDVKEFDNHLTDSNSLIIEDAAHALGSTYPNGEKVGNSAYSEMTIFSFHPAKTITTGEGGMVTTSSRERYEKLLRIRDNGIERNGDLYPGYYISTATTSNLHMNEMQGALGLSQLKKLPRFAAKRKALLKQYQHLFQNTPHVKPLETTDGTVPHIMVVRIDFAALKKDRKRVMEELKSLGVGTQVHYPPLYHHTPYNAFAPLTEMESYFNEALTLPLFTQLEEDDISYIASSLKTVLSTPKKT